MELKIHKKDGLIELFTTTTKIIIDQGKNLEENEVILPSDLETNYHFGAINAIFHTGYKTDYVSMTKGFYSDVPVYSGKLSSQIAVTCARYKSKKPVTFAGIYADAVPITIGDIKITPYLVDDIKHNGYLLMIESETKKICFFGDLAANGRVDFTDVVSRLPNKVDILICGASMITEEDTSIITEGDIQSMATQIMNDTKGAVFILQSPTNFDRATTMLVAARPSKRLYLQDLYMAQIAHTIPQVMPAPSTFVKAYLTNGYSEDHYRYRLFKQLDRISLAELTTEKIAISIRTSMKKYLKTLSRKMNFKNAIIINALPQDKIGCLQTTDFLDFAKSKGLQSVKLATSGHADAKALRTLITKINPKEIAPVTLKNMTWLKREYSHIVISNLTV